MEIHIGSLIKNKMKEINMSNAALAQRIETTRQNIPNLLGRKTMQVDLLHQISVAMNYDFFQHYCLVKHQEIIRQHIKEKETLIQQFTSAEKRLQTSEQEVNTLTRIIEALKK